jgi:hypothetical protein
MTLRATHMTPTDLPEPHYYGYAVHFGFEPNSNMGALSKLSHEIVIRKWLHENAAGLLIKVQGHRLVFGDADDAMLCYLAFR